MVRYQSTVKFNTHPTGLKLYPIICYSLKYKKTHAQTEHEFFILFNFFHKTTRYFHQRHQQSPLYPSQYRLQLRHELVLFQSYVG